VVGGEAEVVLGSDDWFGDIELLSDGASSVTVIALTDVECIVMSRPEFVHLFDAVPPFRKRLVRSIATIARYSVVRSKVPHRQTRSWDEVPVTMNHAEQRLGTSHVAGLSRVTPHS